MAETGSMISRAVPEVPKDKDEQRKYIQKILRDHFRDIQTLFETCTDCDLFEKKQRDNEQL